LDRQSSAPGLDVEGVLKVGLRRAGDYVNWWLDR